MYRDPMLRKQLTSRNDLYGDLAQILCDITSDVLWEGTRNWVLERKPNATFRARVGSGNKTYCSSDPHGNFVITFGRVMIFRQFDPNDARFWTHGKEIVDRGYFSGELDLPQLLAQVTCHEYAHLVQVIKGWRYNGAMHPPEFYRVLDRMHEGGSADFVLAEIESRCGAAGVPLEFCTELRPERTKEDFPVGETVWFTEGGGNVVVGTVVKHLRKRVEVEEQDTSRDLKRTYRITPFHLNLGLPPK